jgi:hypothetical protein
MMSTMTYDHEGNLADRCVRYKAVVYISAASPKRNQEDVAYSIRSQGQPSTTPDFIAVRSASTAGVQRTSKSKSFGRNGDTKADLPRYFVNIPVPREKPIPYIGASGNILPMYSMAVLRSQVAPQLARWQKNQVRIPCTANVHAPA